MENHKKVNSGGNNRDKQNLQKNANFEPTSLTDSSNQSVDQLSPQMEKERNQNLEDSSAVGQKSNPDSENRTEDLKSSTSVTADWDRNLDNSVKNKSESPTNQIFNNNPEEQSNKGQNNIPQSEYNIEEITSENENNIDSPQKENKNINDNFNRVDLNDEDDSEIVDQNKSPDTFL